jgi:cyanophycin synthetase
MKKIQEQPKGGEQIPLLGYYKGIRQRSVILNVEILVPQKINFPQLASKLNDCFDLGIKPIDPKIIGHQSTNQHAAEHFFQLTTQLAGRLLQAIKIPCFADCVITEISVLDPNAGRYKAVCHFPAVENHVASWINKCIVHAHQLITRLSDSELKQTELAVLLEDLHEEFIEPAKKMNPGGESTIPILKTAFNLNIPIMHVGGGIYQLGWGEKLQLTDRSSGINDSAVGAKISSNKIASAHLLRQAGLPAPIHILVHTQQAAIDAAQKIGFPVVVKPADKERGEGVTVGINDIGGLINAFDVAAKISKNILVERQVDGICHRILIAHGKHLYTVARLAISVQADGIHCVKDLIYFATELENRKAKHLRNKPLPTDALAESTLKDQGLSFESIPENGRLIFLRPIESTEWGGTPKVVTEEIHPENIRIALQAAQLVGLNVVGVDLISEDISKPWYENGAVINEVNFAPFLGQRFDFQKMGVERVVKGLFADGARIPIQVFIGDHEALTAAKARQAELYANGVRCFVTSSSISFDVSEEIKIAPPCQGLFARCRALLMNRNVQALMIVIQTDELVSFGSPVDSIDQIEVVNQNLASQSNPELKASLDAFDKTLELLKPYLIKKEPQ